MHRSYEEAYVIQHSMDCRDVRTEPSDQFITIVCIHCVLHIKCLKTIKYLSVSLCDCLTYWISPVHGIPHSLIDILHTCMPIINSILTYSVQYLVSVDHV